VSGLNHLPKSGLSPGTLSGVGQSGVPAWLIGGEEVRGPRPATINFKAIKSFEIKVL